MPEKGPKSSSEVAVKLKIRELTVNSARDQSWVDDITASGLEQGAHIARCNAKLINRDLIRPCFWQDMEEVSEDTCSLAFGLFDRYGRVERKYVEPGFRQGNGAWGRELDHGNILLFEKLTVDSEARRRGVGTKLVQAVLDRVRGIAGQRKFIVVVGPGILNQGVDETDKDEALRVLATARRFWRSLGFRRVGTSSWFAFSDDPGHPSQQLDISKEWDAPQETGPYTAVSAHVQEALSNLLSIRHLNAEQVHQLEETLPGDAEDERWFATDEDGNTVLHLAAIRGSQEVTTYIVLRCPSLGTARNREGDTPLEALQTSMEHRRTRRNYMDMMEVVSDMFPGFSQQIMACVGLLSGTRLFDLTQLSREEISEISSATDEQARMIHTEADAIRHTLRLKYGCICGTCIGGFLSPRMKRMLIEQAAIQRDEDTMMFDDDDWIDQVHEILSNRFTECLQNGMIPSEDNIVHLVSDEEHQTLDAFLQDGGTVNHQISTIFERILGSEDWGLLLRNDPQVTALYEKLPECRNDLELGFVSGMCGYRRVSPGRQYYHDGLLDDEEDGEDEDDDDY
ncbi:hypothetical protein PG996_009114 [Apiospora saccharicola]|uniref:N-acetyltransferase domain-containing protein n=1 Tax=Apiospora saccharicola TaxID=335842 RepID=A0ABR1UJW1_9PEZI